MLASLKFTRTRIWNEGFRSQGLVQHAAKMADTGWFCGKGKENYGRLQRSHEHSPGVAIPGGESVHALQVRQRAEDSGVQAGQSLAFQEVEAGSVDGGEVDSIRSQSQKETQVGWQSGRVTVKAGTCLDSGRRRLWVWMWVPRASRRSNCGRKAAPLKSRI